SSGDTARRRASRSRMPSSVGYLFAAIAAASLLFFALWWMLFTGGDEAPWISAGLAASLVLLVALSAREVVMRRAWTRYLLEHGVPEHAPRVSTDHSVSGRKSYSATAHKAALRILQNQSADADAGARPELHLEMFKLCQVFVSTADEALRSNSLTAEKRSIFRAGQERARVLEKHHMLTWARDSSLALTHEAQRRARMTDKIETAYRALDCLDAALKVYPAESELNASKSAIWEFIASVKVAHWVELAERAAFKGHYRRAIDRYKDALFYLNRDTGNEEIRAAGAERIGREIESLRSTLRKSPSPPEDSGSGSSKEEEDAIN
ncbi:MAG TPA: hypothetical protein VJS64_16815, partial [Pyrinomonadaceae bacterium]|nr:hypothetical protein [Pyrinomonadaceae bacterium]